MWEVQGEARAGGLLPGREQSTAIIRQGSAGRKRLLTHRKLNSAGISPSSEGQGSVLSAVEQSRWGSSRHSLPSRSCSSSPSLMALQHNPLGKGMLPCRAVKQGSFWAPGELPVPLEKADIALPASARAEPRHSTLLSPEWAVSSSSGSVYPSQSEELRSWEHAGLGELRLNAPRFS